MCLAPAVANAQQCPAAAAQGEYLSANQLQDDFAVMQNHMFLLADDNSNSMSGATALSSGEGRAAAAL
jgi:hypothetical protein